LLRIKTYSSYDSGHKFIIALLIILIIAASALVFKLTKKCPGAEEKCPAAPECPACSLDCSKCPSTIKYQNITNTITNYICPNKRVVQNIDDCEKPKPLATAPKMTNEAGTVIEVVTVKPACISGVNGGAVLFKVGTIPYNVFFQAREEDTAYAERHNIAGLLTKYVYFTICGEGEFGCKGIGDFYIEKDRAFLLRVGFNQTARHGRIEYSNEHIVDTTAGSEYLTEKCSSK